MITNREFQSGLELASIEADKARSVESLNQTEKSDADPVFMENSNVIEFNIPEVKVELAPKAPDAMFDQKSLEEKKRLYERSQAAQKIAHLANMRRQRRM